MGKFVVSVEMDPPRGLSTHKLLAGASLLAEAGADVINVADSPMARMRMSPWAVCDLVQRTGRRGDHAALPHPRAQPAARAGRPAGRARPGHPQCVRRHGRPDLHRRLPRSDGQLRPGALRADQADQAELQPGRGPRRDGYRAADLLLRRLRPQPDARRTPSSEIKNLRRKLQAGADFILTQPVYQPELAEAFLDRYQEQHGSLEIPILVGVLPLYSARHAAFLHNEVPGISIPDDLMQRMESAGEMAQKEGVRIALELVEQMKAWCRGIYLMPQFNRYDLAAEIVEGVK